MTEDTSPENLRKFLESDDPALVIMGLSMAKGSGVPEELLPSILGLYMWNDDKTIRAAAKSTFTSLAPVKLKKKVKDNWKPSYRNLSVYGDKYQEAIRQFQIAFKSQDNFSLIILEPLIKDFEKYKKRGIYNMEESAKALGKIDDKHAVKPLIKALSYKVKSGDFGIGSGVRVIAAGALGVSGNTRAVEPLIKALKRAASESEISWLKNRDYYATANALGKIGDKRAVELLIKLIEDEKLHFVSRAKRTINCCVENGINGFCSCRKTRRVECLIEALGMIGDTRAVEPLIEIMRKDGVWTVCVSAALALGEIGDVRAVESLIKGSSMPRSSNSGKWVDFDMYNKKAVETLRKIKTNIVEKYATNDYADLYSLLMGKTIERNWSVGILQNQKFGNDNVKEKKNILKFLKSKDTAMVQMGILMLKGILEESPRTRENFWRAMILQWYVFAEVQ